MRFVANVINLFDYVNHQQCDQIGRFIGLWATF